jgi:hypothetical protein
MPPSARWLGRAPRELQEPIRDPRDPAKPFAEGPSDLHHQHCSFPEGTIAEAKRRLAPRQPPEAWSRPTGPAVTIEDATSSSNTSCIRIRTTTRLADGHVDNVVGSGESTTAGSGESTSTTVVEFVDNVLRVEHAQFTCAWGDDLPTEPTVLLGCCNEWPAFVDADKQWTVPNLAQRERAATASASAAAAEECLFSVDGGPGFARESYGEGRVTMCEYDHYCRGQAGGDAAPLYVFDHRCLKPSGPREGTAGAGAETNSLSLCRDFDVPPSFRRDVMSGLTGSQFRPLPPAWLLVGCARSGTPIHDHPLTVAWNALLSGCKLWALLPPDVGEASLLLNSSGSISEATERLPQSEDEDDGADFDLSALDWFGWGCTS